MGEIKMLFGSIVAVFAPIFDIGLEHSFAYDVGNRVLLFDMV